MSELVEFIVPLNRSFLGQYFSYSSTDLFYCK